MKIIPPELQVNHDAGFDPAIDIFKRSEFGEQLANLIENAGGNPVFALDAGWGQGKSTFIKMWRGYLEHKRAKKVRTIYFDAFENDYQKDAFLALASEMYQLISQGDEPKQVAFKQKLIKACKSLFRGGTKLAVRTATAGIIDGGMLDKAETEISNLVADQFDELIKDRFEHAYKDKLALKEFKTYLETFAEEQGNGSPIVFIIDELDRCKPDFALELLEQVKHLFSVQGITFLLVTNRAQLEESIKTRYGQQIDSVNYLHKFVNVWLQMPRATEEYNDNGYQYLQYALNSMCSREELNKNPEMLADLSAIVKYYRPSFREIERTLSYFAIANNMITGTYSTYVQGLIAIVCYLKACKPIALMPVNGQITYEQIATSAEFGKIVTSKQYDMDYLIKLVRYDFSTDEEKKKMIAEREVSFSGFSREPDIPAVILINKWLNGITTN